MSVRNIDYFSMPPWWIRRINCVPQPRIRNIVQWSSKFLSLLLLIKHSRIVLSIICKIHAQSLLDFLESLCHLNLFIQTYSNHKSSLPCERHANPCILATSFCQTKCFVLVKKKQCLFSMAVGRGRYLLSLKSYLSTHWALFSNFVSDCLMRQWM